MKRLILLVAVLAAGSLIVVLAAGGSAYKTSTAHGAPNPSSGGRAVIGLGAISLGRILVDGQGRTLYLFEADKPGMSACSGACASVWPPVTSAGAPRLRGASLTATLATIPAAGGGRQVTYNGHPLYRYAGDTQPGATTGQGLDQFGAKWFVLSARGGGVGS